MNESKSLPPLPGPRTPHGEFWPVSSPPFRDHVKPPWQEKIDAWKRFDSDPAEAGLTKDVIQKAERVSLNNGDVYRLLKNKRYIAIGASLRASSGLRNERVRSVLFVFYNYTDNLAIEVRLNSTVEKVLEVFQKRLQPTAVDAELEHAIALAKQSPKLAKHMISELESNALLLKGVDAYDRQAFIPYYYHRLFEVSFRRGDERAPLFQALVDLSTETVIHVLSFDPSTTVA